MIRWEHAVAAIRWLPLLCTHPEPAPFTHRTISLSHSLRDGAGRGAALRDGRSQGLGGRRGVGAGSLEGWRGRMRGGLVH